MKRFLASAFLLLCCLAALDARSELPPAYATPQATLSSYWLRMIERRHTDALDCFLGGRASDAGNMLALPDLVELRCRDFQLDYRSGGHVDVNYRIEYRISMGDSLASFPTGDRLSLTGSGWKIALPLMLASRP